MMRRIKKSMDNKCFCTGKVKEQLVAVAGCSEDLAAVLALPDQWMPRHSGPTLTSYLKERENNHETCLENLMQDAKNVNKDIDEKIRAISEILLAHIQQNQEDIESLIKKSQPDDSVITIEARNEALKEITKLFTCRTQEFVKFKQEALRLERQRTEGMRNVLKSQFQRFIVIGHKTPKDLLHDFDDRIYEINQQLLSNSRAYIELEAQLRVQLDEDIIRARSSLNRLSIKQSKKVIRGQSALPWTRNSQYSHKRCDSASDTKRHEPDNYSQEVMFYIEEFKACVTQLVEAYRRAILKVFTGFSYKLDNLNNDIGITNLNLNKNNSCTLIPELENMIGRALERISSSNVQVKSSIYKDLEEMARNDIFNMQKSVSMLGQRLRDTYIILYDASHLWDNHILRSALAQKLSVTAAEDIQNTNDTVELANEVNFNITLEQLRYAADAEKLQQNYDVALNLLDRVADMYVHHNEIEISKLEEYMNLPPIMTNILLSECECFLESHPTSKTITETSGNLASPAGSPNSKSAFSLRAPLPRAILQTQLQEIALNNWKNGFLESFDRNLPALSGELNREARKWVDDRSLRLNMRHSLKLMSHSIRAERVKAAREIRLADIKFHDQRLNSHLEAMYVIIDGFPCDASAFLALDSSELYPFCNWIKSIQTDMDDMLAREPLDPEMKRLKVTSYAHRLLKHRQLFEESIDTAIEQYKKDIEYKIQVARIANFRFVSQLKLFIEGGRYAASEATKTCATLVKAADALELCVHRTMDVLHHRRPQLLALADQQVLPLQRVVDEVCKFGAKNVYDKKKPPPNRKK